MIVEIDKNSGFCFGVKRAIDHAEKLLADGEALLCLGNIVHNQEEVDRLNRLGMKTVDHKSLPEISGKTILLRSHGEPPETYTQAKSQHNKIIDATCPVVLKLQSRVRKSYEEQQQKNGQILIYGKKGHPEVIGLVGQTNNEAFVVSNVDDLDNIDFNQPIELYAQTTMPLDAFDAIKKHIEENAKDTAIVHDTICRQVANRIPNIKAFALQYDVVVFVSGKNSSNGKLLFEECRKANPNSYFISSTADIQTEWFIQTESIGISGATSTPHWLMEEVKAYLQKTLNNGEFPKK